MSSKVRDISTISVRRERSPDVSADESGTVWVGPSPAPPAGVVGQPLDDIAVIVPVYMGKAVLRELCDRLVAALSSITDRFSIILVDDRSPDDAWPLIQELGRGDRRIRGIQLSRNFGQHYALTAGIDHARAKWYVVMDCDLQDAPEDIPVLYDKARDGHDMVVGARTRKEHSWHRRASSRLFYGVLRRLSGLEADSTQGNFRIFSDRVADGFRQIRERPRFFPATLSWMGFETATVPLQHHARKEGRSSYSLVGLLKCAVDTILVHTMLPLKAVAVFGLVMSVISMFLGIALALKKLIWGVPVDGWTSLIVAICVIGGLQMLMIGILGLYIGKNFEETKRRPLYLVREFSNFK